MNKLKLKYLITKSKTQQFFYYSSFRFYSLFGKKYYGYNKYTGLVLMSLLKKHNDRKNTLSISVVDKNLNQVNLEELHNYGLRANYNDHITLFLNPLKHQFKIFVGRNLKSLINKKTSLKISGDVQPYINKDEFLVGIEIALINISKKLKKI